MQASNLLEISSVINVVLIVATKSMPTSSDAELHHGGSLALIPQTDSRPTRQRLPLKTSILPLPSVVNLHQSGASYPPNPLFFTVIVLCKNEGSCSATMGMLDEAVQYGVWTWICPEQALYIIAL